MKFSLNELARNYLRKHLDLAEGVDDDVLWRACGEEISFGRLPPDLLRAILAERPSPSDIGVMLTHAADPNGSSDLGGIAQEIEYVAPELYEPPTFDDQ